MVVIKRSVALNKQEKLFIYNKTQNDFLIIKNINFLNFFFQILGKELNQYYNHIFIVGDSRILKLPENWPERIKDECPTVISKKDLTFNDLQDGFIEDNCDFISERNLLVCSFGLHDLLNLEERKKDFCKHQPFLIPNLSNKNPENLALNILTNMKSFKNNMVSKMMILLSKTFKIYF